MDSHPTGVPGRIAVVTLNYNGLDDTFKCLDSLRHVVDSDWRVYVVENGSTPSPVEAIVGAHDWVEVIRLDQNVGWAGGNNVGIQRALQEGAKYIILLNNDTIVDPQLLKRLRLAAAACPEHGVLGPVICYMDEPDRVNVDGCIFNDPREDGFFHRQPVPWQTSDPPSVVDTEIVNGCCMMMPAEVFARVGMIDEQFFLVHEESEFCLRVRRAGLRCGIVSEPLVWHKGSSYYQREPKPLQRYYDARNICLILRKHGGASVLGSGRWRAWIKYLRHVYFMYCCERDRGDQRGANAVLEGFVDALARRFGPLRDRRRPLVAMLRPLIEFKRLFSLSANSPRSDTGSGGVRNTAEASASSKT